MAISLGGFSGGGGGGNITSVNGQTGIVVISGDDVAADHSASNYTAANSNVDGHLSGIDTKLGTLASGLTYKGTFNATAGTPSLANAEQGDLYVIDTAGTIYGNTFAIGDHLLVNANMGGSIINSKIDKIDNTDQVTSVNGNTGAVTVSGDDLAADHSASNYTAANANIDGHLSGIDSKFGTLATVATSGAYSDLSGTPSLATVATTGAYSDLSGTPSLATVATSGAYSDLSGLPTLGTASASATTDFLASTAGLDNLSDVSYTPGADIDNYVLTYDHSTTSWGAEVVPSASLFTTTTTALATYDASVNEIINLTANTGGEIRVNLPSSASSGDIIILRKPTNTSSASPAGQATRIAVYNSSGTKLKDLELYPVLGSHILSYDGSDWTFPVTNLSYAQSTSNSYTLYGYRFGHSIIYADNAESTAFTVNIQVAASSLLEGARQRIFTRGERNVIITSTSTDIVDPTGGATNEVLVNTITVPAHAGIIEIWVNSQSQYMINAPLANLGTSAFLDVGTTANKVVQLNSSAQLPALNGSLLTNLNIVEDTSPQLGGNLDVNGQDIVSVSNGDIEVAPNGNGSFIIKGNATSGSGRVVLNCEQNTHGITLKGPPHSAAASYTLTFPNTDGNADQVLKSDGNGNLDWVDQASGSTAPSVTTDSTGSDTTITTSTGIEEVHLISNGANNVTITIPGATSAGYKYNIKRLGSGTVTIQASSGTIDTGANFSLASQFDSVTLVSDATNYHII